MTAIRSDRPPLMVFSGEFWRGASGFGLAQGFRKLGWEVQEIDLQRIFGTNAKSLPARVARRLLASHLANDFDNEVRETVKVLSPQLFLSIKGTLVSRELLQWLGQRGIARALYYPDVHFDHPGISLDDFTLYDYVFTTKTFHLDFLRRKIGTNKVYYVPHGYSDDVHKPLRGAMAEHDYDTDIQHVGTHSAYKQQWLEALMAGCPGAELRVIGPRWQTATGTSKLQETRPHDAMLGCAYSLALQGARINVAVMMGPYTFGWQDNVSTRTFEIPACGGFQLHIDSDELREFFTPGIDLDVFSTPEELCDKARFYLNRPDVRERMIASAYERCVPAYGYAARAEQMIDIIAKSKS